MAVRLRLQRHGKKGRPFFHIVAADQRSPRDGRFIEKIGTYDPTTIPASIDLDVEKAVDWLQKGAESTNTVKAILKYKGAAYKNHLLNGVRKGALKLEDVDTKFQAFLDEKTKKVSGHIDNVAKAKAEARAKALEAEKEVQEKRRKAIEDAQKAAEEVEVETTEETEAPVAEAETPAEENTDTPPTE